MLHYEAVEPATLELLKQVQRIPFLSETRLVGGTSLALQIGHRKSVDIDLFGEIAMKITAIIGRGTKKDFIDLAFLLDYFSLDEILNFYEKKYPEASRFMAIKSVAYFDDAEVEPMPYMLNERSWGDVKERVLKEIWTSRQPRMDG